MVGISGWELMVIILGVLLLFGPKAIPNFSRKLAQTIKEFQKAVNEIKNDLKV